MCGPHTRLRGGQHASRATGDRVRCRPRFGEVHARLPRRPGRIGPPFELGSNGWGVVTGRCKIRRIRKLSRNSSMLPATGRPTGRRRKGSGTKRKSVADQKKRTAQPDDAGVHGAGMHRRRLGASAESSLSRGGGRSIWSAAARAPHLAWLRRRCLACARRTMRRFTICCCSGPGPLLAQPGHARFVA